MGSGRQGGLIKVWLNHYYNVTRLAIYAVLLLTYIYTIYFMGRLTDN